MKKTILTFMTILAMATTAKAAFLVPGGSTGDFQYRKNQYSIGGVPILNFDGTDLTMSGLMNVTGTMDFTGVILVPGADTLPLPCTNRQLGVDTNATSGQRLYVCENGTWVQQGGSGSGSTECSTSSCDLNAATTKGGAAIQTGAEDDQPDSDAEVPDNITVNPVNATTEAAIEAVVDLQDLQGAVTDGQVPDTITVSNYVPLSGAQLTGQLGIDNLGLEFEESDTNPTCNSGNYGLWADLSEQKLKKCENGVSSDIGATSGAGESNTASNVGSQGVGLFKQKSGVDLEFYKLSSANSIISVALSGTDFLQITANEGNINHDNLAGFVANEHIDWTSDQGATNIDPANYPITDSEVPAGIHRDSETKDGDLVSFDDADSKFTATTVDDAISELDNVNGSGPNASDAKVDWSQIGNMPAGFADGTDDGAGGGSPGGSDTYVQFNDGGSSFGGDSGLTYNKTTDSLTVGGSFTVDTSTFFVDGANNRVGIGTTAPSAELEITSDSPEVVFNVSGNTVSIGTDDGYIFNLKQNGTTRFTVDNAGNINVNKIQFSGDTFLDRFQDGVLGISDNLNAYDGTLILGRIGVGTSVPSAILDLSATDSALRVTRLSDPSSDISSPLNGMIAYDSTDDELQAYVGGSWKNLAATSSGGGGSCWEIDGSGDLQPISGSCSDTLWEIDGSGDLQPKT